MNISLRARLILLLGMAIVLAAMVQFAASFYAATDEADKLFDYHMQRMALALQEGGFEQASWYSALRSHQTSYDFVIQVWEDETPRLFQSRVDGLVPRQRKQGYSTVNTQSGPWRVYVEQTASRTIQVAQKMQTRRDRAISLALHAVWPVIPVSFLLFVAAWWVITSALRPLDRIGRDLANRTADSLTPVSAHAMPHELRSLVMELNALLARVTEALQSHRRFIADAAHELRSPITALKLQVQTLARARDPDAHAQAIGRLLGGIDRASRLVEQLLSLAREEPSSRDVEPVITSISDSVQQALTDVTSLASTRNISLQCRSLDCVTVLGDADSLRIMIRNLLDNAIRYSPENGQVQVDLVRDAAFMRLTIQDSGPGIESAEIARVFDRFYRVPGTSATGSGLGLAIVRTIAARHGGSVDLARSAMGGLMVTVCAPLHTASP